jgi:hypothetical protein
MGMFSLTKNIFRHLIHKTSNGSVFTLNVIDRPENPIEFYPGMHTIKNSKAEGPRAALFEITDKNLIKGYFHATGDVRTLDLTSGKPKLIALLKASYYHFFIDDVASIIEALQQYPDHELIIDVSEVSMLLDSQDNSKGFYFEFLFLLKYYNIAHKIVRITDYDVVYIDDFYIVKYTKISSESATKVYEYFLPFVPDKDVKPYRNVYVSRRIQEERDPYEVRSQDEKFYFDGKRVDDEVALEKFFKKLGFEIVNPELFEDLSDQINFFYSVKTIASLTSSGLTNSVFMQPGGTIIELVSPIVASPIAPDGTYAEVEVAIHNFYKDLAFLKNHVYVAIQNPDYKFKDIEKAILANPALKRFLTVKNEKPNNI